MGKMRKLKSKAFVNSDALAYVTIAEDSCTPRYVMTQYWKQRNPIMRFAYRRYEVRRMVCEVMANAPSDLFARMGFLRLLSMAGHWVTWWKNKVCAATILIHARTDLITTDVDLAALALHLRGRAIALVEVSTGEELTSEINVQKLVDGLAPEEIATARSRLGKALQKSSRMRTGRKCGVPAFGERSGEKETLEEILRLRRKPPKGRRMSYRKIAMILNSRKLKTRSGKPWTPSTIRGIVQRIKPHLARAEATPKYRG